MYRTKEDAVERKGVGMTQEQVTFYGDLFEHLSLSELKIEEEGSMLYFKKELPPSVIHTPQEVITSADNGGMSNGLTNSVNKRKQDEIKAPLLGIFHRAPSPEEPPFVKEGDRVKKGDVLCVIEAMKMMNEITAARDGVIASICVEENTIVEYGQTIFELV